MGSSSSFTVGLLNTLYQLRNINLTKKELANKSLLFEQKILKEVVGSQDQIACFFGGFNQLNLKKEIIKSINLIYQKKTLVFLKVIYF